MRIAIAALNFLIETLQGPCLDNQHYIVMESHGIELCKQVLSSPFSTRANPKGKGAPNLVLKLKGLGVKLLASCLEGRSDKRNHAKLADILELPMLRDLDEELSEKHMVGLEMVCRVRIRCRNNHE